MLGSCVGSAFLLSAAALRCGEKADLAPVGFRQGCFWVEGTAQYKHGGVRGLVRKHFGGLYLSTQQAFSGTFVGKALREEHVREKDELDKLVCFRES